VADIDLSPVLAGPLFVLRFVSDYSLAL